jgi:hypothetical protein
MRSPEVLGPPGSVAFATECVPCRAEWGPEGSAQA